MPVQRLMILIDRPLRICVVTSSYPRFQGDAVGAFVHEMCVNLQRMGDKVVVVAPHGPSIPRRAVIDGVNIYRFPYGITERQQNIAYSYGIFENVRRAPWIAAEIPLFLHGCVSTCLNLSNLYEFDIFFAQWAIPQGLACVASKGTLRTPIAVLCHGSDVFLARNPLLRLGVAYTLNNSDLVLANSRATASRIVEIGVRRRTHVLYMGVDLSRFKSKRLSVELESADRIKSLLFVGRLTERKGIAHLIHAMKTIAAEVDCKLHVVGDGPLKEKLESYCAHNQLSKRVVFLGNLSSTELLDQYSSSDLFVFPSVTTRTGETEGLGVAALEAMASGKAVVAGDAGGIPELVKNGVNGLVVNASDEKELSRAVIRLLRDDELRQRMGAQSSRIAANYSWSIVARRIHDLLADTVANNLQISKCS